MARVLLVRVAMTHAIELFYRHHLYAQGGGVPLAVEEIASLLGFHKRIPAFVSADGTGGPIEIIMLGLGCIVCTDIEGVDVGENVEVMIESEGRSYCFNATVTIQMDRSMLGLRMNNTPALILPASQAA